jgi:hypothetical protein
MSNFEKNPSVNKDVKNVKAKDLHIVESSNRESHHINMQPEQLIDSKDLNKQNMNKNLIKEDDRLDIEQTQEEGMWDKAKHLMTDVKNSIVVGAEKVGGVIKGIVSPKKVEFPSSKTLEKDKPMHTDLNTNIDINMNLRPAQIEAIVDNKDFQGEKLHQKQWDAPSDIKDINKEKFPEFTGPVVDKYPMIPDKHIKNM